MVYFCGVCGKKNNNEKLNNNIEYTYLYIISDSIYIILYSEFTFVSRSENKNKMFNWKIP